MIELRKGNYRVIARYKGLPAFSATVGPSKADAKEYDSTLRKLAHQGRADVLQALKDGATTIGDVQQAIDKRGLANLTLAQCGVGGRETIAALYDEWILAVKSPGFISRRTRRPLGKGTLQRYQDSWANFFAHHKGGRSAPIKTLTTEALELFASSRMRVDEVSASTVNRDLTAIQSFIRWLREKHPHALPSLPRFDKHAEPDYSADAMHLERDEYARLRAKMETRWHPLFDLLVQTGLRIGEAQGLRCEDVTTHQVFVHRDVKTPSSKRRVPLNDSLSKMLQAYIKDRPKDEHVFLPYLRSRDNAYHAFVVASLAAGLCEGDPPKATHSPHSLRHTFGVTAARAGLTLLEIRDLLGHSDIGVTQRYAQYAPDNDRSKHQAAAIGKLLAIESLDTPLVPQTLTLRKGRKALPRDKSVSKK